MEREQGGGDSKKWEEVESDRRKRERLKKEREKDGEALCVCVCNSATNCKYEVFALANK